MYFAFVYSKIKYGIEVFGSCSKNQLHRLQVIQNGLLKLLLQLDRRTNTNQLHRSLRLLKVEHIYKMHILLFVNNCLENKSIPFFNNFYSTREVTYNLRNQRINNDISRINVGLASVKNIGSKEWYILPQELKNKSRQVNFRKHIASHFITQYN